MVRCPHNETDAADDLPILEGEVLAISANDFFSFLQSNVLQNTITAFSTDSLQARLFIIEVDVRDHAVLLNTTCNVVAPIVPISLIVEALSVQVHRLTLLVQARREKWTLSIMTDHPDGSEHAHLVLLILHLSQLELLNVGDLLEHALGRPLKVINVQVVVKQFDQRQFAQRILGKLQLLLLQRSSSLTRIWSHEFELLWIVFALTGS